MVPTSASRGTLYESFGEDLFIHVCQHPWFASKYNVE
jgi:hypothetical protein